MKNIKLTLSGSGTLYPIHVGAIIALWRQGYHIEEICGVSGGAIIAAAVASGFNSEVKLRNMAIDMLPIWDWSLSSALNFGLIKGDAIKNQFKKNFKNTFQDTEIPLHIINANLSQRKKEVYSTLSTPDEIISERIRSSISFPGVFEAYRDKGNIYIDGGVYSNFPIEVIGKKDNHFGVQIMNKNIAPIKNIFDYLGAMADAFVKKTEEDEIEEYPNVTLIRISTAENNMNLKMNKQNVIHLIELGISETNNVLLKI